MGIEDEIGLDCDAEEFDAFADDRDGLIEFIKRLSSPAQLALAGVAGHEWALRELAGLPSGQSRLNAKDAFRLAAPLVRPR